jgi:hypothetical protein
MSSKTTYLRKDELVELTDRQLPGKQIEWLRSNGWKFAVSASGHPKVAREYHDYRLGTVEIEPDESQEPDFSHWTKQHGGAKKTESRAGNVQALRVPG